MTRNLAIIHTLTPRTAGLAIGVKETDVFHRIMAAALTFGALGGASLAFAHNRIITPGALADTSVSPDSRASATCQPVTFRIYFAPGSLRLNREADVVIDSVSQRFAACDVVQFQLAADPHQLARPEDRHRVSARSVAILSALRSKGVIGDVYVAPLGKGTTVADASAGPDFVEVGVTPTRTPVLMSSNARETEI